MKRVVPVGSLSFLLIFLVACATHKPVALQCPGVANLPDNKVEQPAVTEISPVRGEVKELSVNPALATTEAFTKFEKDHVRVKDPRLFKNGNKMSIHLSKIPACEFVFPLKGAKVISDYGRRGKRNHTGMDLKTRANDTIVAAFDGVVRMSCPYAAYGNVVVIRHDMGLETVYSHNVKNLVKVGRHVKAGDPVALTGRTGRATTEHLHFEIRVNGQHIDPDRIIDFGSYTLRKQTVRFSRSTDGSISVK